MMRRFPWAFVLIALLVGQGPAPGQEGSASTEKDQALRFLQGLRDRGYYDLSLEYLETLRKAADTPADLKEVLDYEEGRSLLDESSRMADLERRATQLDKARVKLDAFAKGHPKHELAPQALVQMARLLFERGQTAALQANEAETPAEKQTELAKARAAFDQARNAYDAAHVPILANFSKFPKFIPEDDPDKPKFTRAHVALMDAELQRALVDYEEAQTYEPKAKQRSELLNKARLAFEDIYKRYRTQLAGLYARMWQAKCYEENGELGPAMGIYKELMDHTAPELRDLQRKVAYFQIIIDGKRGEYPLAVDQAAKWLNLFPSARNTQEGLGVQLELAKSLLAQLGDLSEKDQEQAIRRATDILQPVVRVYSPVKPEALALLKKYRPQAALNATAIASLNFDNAYADAEGAVQTHEYNRAIALLRHAISRAEREKNLDNVNKARYLMAYACYAGGSRMRPPCSVDTWRGTIPRTAWPPRGPRSPSPRWPPPTERTPRSTARPISIAWWTSASTPPKPSPRPIRATSPRPCSARSPWVEATTQPPPPPSNRSAPIPLAGSTRRSRPATPTGDRA
jgi:hypothetical protein